MTDRASGGLARLSSSAVVPARVLPAPALARALVPVPVLVLVLGLGLGLGCSAITKFDYRYDGDAASRDGGPSVDGGPGVDGGDAGAVDGGGTPTTCPAPCLADLSVDAIDGMQSTGTAMWRYLADPGDANGLRYEPLAWAAAAGQWEGSGATIRRCDASCEDSDAFRFGSTSTGDATVELTVATRGAYRLGGSYEVLAGDSQAVLVSHDGRNDVLAEQRGSSDGAAAIDHTLYLEAGDRVRITLATLGGAPSASAALRLWVSGPTTASDRTVFAVDFDETTPPWRGQSGEVTAAATNVGGSRYPTSIASDIGFGNAVRIASADQAFVNVMGSDGFDASGDFTIQAWGRYDAVTGSDRRALLSTLSSAIDSWGIVIDHDGTSIASGGFASTGEVLLTTAFSPAMGEWHFYRLVRSASVLTLCVDGVQRGTSTVGDADFTSGATMTLGYQRGTGPWFDGAIDELRVYHTALPCAVSP